MPRKAEPRNRANPIRVFVNDRERAIIARRAAVAGTSISAFLRAAGQGAVTRSVLDLEAIDTLAEVNRDQAALLAALRQLPADMDTKQIIRQIGIVQATLVKAASKVRT